MSDGHLPCFTCVYLNDILCLGICLHFEFFVCFFFYFETSFLVSLYFTSCLCSVSCPCDCLHLTGFTCVPLPPGVFSLRVSLRQVVCSLWSCLVCSCRVSQFHLCSAFTVFNVGSVAIECLDFLSCLPLFRDCYFVYQIIHQLVFPCLCWGSACANSELWSLLTLETKQTWFLHLFF